MRKKTYSSREPQPASIESSSKQNFVKEVIWNPYPPRKITEKYKILNKSIKEYDINLKDASVLIQKICVA